MMIVKFNMLMNPKNSNEILNAVKIISQSVRTEEGCMDIFSFQSFNNENELIIIEYWKSMTLLKKHWKTPNFGALLGIQSLLSLPIKVEINKVTKSLGLKEVEKVRADKKTGGIEKGLMITNTKKTVIPNNRIKYNQDNTLYKH
jgi:quinol monooxygenase YgiN